MKHRNEISENELISATKQASVKAMILVEFNSVYVAYTKEKVGCKKKCIVSVVCCTKDNITAAYTGMEVDTCWKMAFLIEHILKRDNNWVDVENKMMACDLWRG